MQGHLSKAWQDFCPCCCLRDTHGPWVELRCLVVALPGCRCVAHQGPPVALTATRVSTASDSALLSGAQKGEQPCCAFLLRSPLSTDTLSAALYKRHECIQGACMSSLLQKELPWTCKASLSCPKGPPPDGNHPGKILPLEECNAHAL